MNTQNGEIHETMQAGLRAGVDRDFLMPMTLDPTARQRRRMKVGRNDPCPCGSGQKFKKCHLGQLVRG